MPDFVAFYLKVDNTETNDILAVYDVEADVARWGDAVTANGALAFFESADAEWWNQAGYISGTVNEQDPYDRAELLTDTGAVAIIGIREDNDPVQVYDRALYDGRRAYWRANPGGYGSTPLYADNNLNDVVDPAAAAANLGALQIANNLDDLDDGETAWDNLNAVAPAGAMLKASNLSDVDDISESRNSLAVGTNDASLTQNATDGFLIVPEIEDSPPTGDSAVNFGIPIAIDKGNQLLWANVGNVGFPALMKLPLVGPLDTNLTALNNLSDLDDPEDAAKNLAEGAMTVLTGSFLDNDGNTINVVNGIIISKVAP